MAQARMPLIFNTKEMVIIAEGPLDIDKLTKEGWMTLVYYGDAEVRLDGRWGRLLPFLRKSVPMYKLTKKKAKEP